VPVKVTRLSVTRAGPLTTVNLTGKPELAVAARLKDPLLLARLPMGGNVMVWLIRLMLSAGVELLLVPAPAPLFAATVNW
jgi:hypothetical protein